MESLLTENSKLIYMAFVGHVRRCILAAILRMYNLKHGTFRLYFRNLKDSDYRMRQTIIDWLNVENLKVRWHYSSQLQLERKRYVLLPYISNHRKIVKMKNHFNIICYMHSTIDMKIISGDVGNIISWVSLLVKLVLILLLCPAYPSFAGTVQIFCNSEHNSPLSNSDCIACFC